MTMADRKSDFYEILAEIGLRPRLDVVVPPVRIMGTRPGRNKTIRRPSASKDVTRRWDLSPRPASKPLGRQRADRPSDATVGATPKAKPTGRIFIVSSPEKQLGDLVLAAEASMGKGRVVFSWVKPAVSPIWESAEPIRSPDAYSAIWPTASTDRALGSGKYSGTARRRCDYPSSLPPSPCRIGCNRLGRVPPFLSRLHDLREREYPRLAERKRSNGSRRWPQPTRLHQRLARRTVQRRPLDGRRNRRVETGSNARRLRPVDPQRFHRRTVEQGRSAILIGPRRSLTSDEQAALREFLKNGGTVVCMVGAEDASGIGETLKEAYGFTFQKLPSLRTMHDVNRIRPATPSHRT